MSNEPITREEILLNAVATGEQENIKPITREEMYLAKLGGADVSVPTPITRKEQFLQKAIENASNTGGGGSADDVSLVAPRAQIRQIVPCIDENGTFVRFEDVHAFANTARDDIGVVCDVMFGLEAHTTTSTQQRVFKSYDGEKWTEYASLTIDAANGVWFTKLFVDGLQSNGPMLLIKTNDGFSGTQNELCTFVWNGLSWWQSGTLALGKKTWLSNNNSIDICTNLDWTKRVIIFGEYGLTTDGTTYSLQRSVDSGTTWEKVLEFNGDSGGANYTGDIRHWHTVQADPYTKHWWATSGDGDDQCRMYRSTDDGETWQLMFAGTQRERTCGFVFEKDYIYYGMDSTNNWDKNSVKIVRIDRSKLETDIENAREDVAVVDSAFAVYGLTRTLCPNGFIVWTQQEASASFTPGRYILQFYDYATEKLYPIAYFNTSDIDSSKYIGFYAGSRVQHRGASTIIARPTISLQEERLGHSSVSTHIRINLTM